MTRSAPTIRGLDVAVFTVPTDQPEADGTIAWDATTVVLVTAHAEESSGIGWTYASAACAPVVADVLAPVVTGRDAFDVPGCAVAMARSVRNLGRAGVAGMALSAVDIALWDLKARLLDLSLVDLLGRVRADVPVYGSGGFTTYDDRRLADQLGGWVGDQGIPRVKIKIGESWGSDLPRDLARTALARRVIGKDAALFVDANGGYRVGQARRVAASVEELDVTWFEEPVSSDDLAGLAQVRSSTRIDVAAGEYGYDLTYLTRMAAAGAVDCLQVDVTRCGGITEWLRAAAAAAGHGLDVSGHCGPNLTAHAAAATPNLRHLEWFHDHVRVDAMLFDGVLDPSGGCVRPDPGAPGHGMTLRASDAAPYRTG